MNINVILRFLKKKEYQGLRKMTLFKTIIYSMLQHHEQI